MSEIDLSTSILRRKLDCRRELYVMTPFVQTRSLLRKHGQRTSIYALTAPASSLCELSPRVLVRLIESQISTIYICSGMSISSLGARRPWDYSKRICSRIHKNPSRYEISIDSDQFAKFVLLSANHPDDAANGGELSTVKKVRLRKDLRDIRLELSHSPNIY